MCCLYGCSNRKINRHPDKRVLTSAQNAEELMRMPSEYPSVDRLLFKQRYMPNLVLLLCVHYRRNNLLLGDRGATV